MRLMKAESAQCAWKPATASKKNSPSFCLPAAAKDSGWSLEVQHVVRSSWWSFQFLPFPSFYASLPFSHAVKILLIYFWSFDDLRGLSLLKMHRFNGPKSFPVVNFIKELSVHLSLLNLRNYSQQGWTCNQRIFATEGAKHILKADTVEGWVYVI